MPPPLVPWQPMLAWGLVLVAVSALPMFLSALEWRRGQKRVAIALLLFGIVLTIPAATSIQAAQRQYVAANTARFEYDLAIEPIGTGIEAVVVPIPASSEPIADLGITRGAANWSLVETIHGPALYVRFSGDLELVGIVEQFNPSGVSWDATPSMREDANPHGASRVWVRYDGPAAHLNLHIQSWTLDGELSPDWNLYPMNALAHP